MYAVLPSKASGCGCRFWVYHARPLDALTRKYCFTFLRVLCSPLKHSTCAEPETRRRCIAGVGVGHHRFRLRDDLWLAALQSWRWGFSVRVMFYDGPTKKSEPSALDSHSGCCENKSEPVEQCGVGAEASSPLHIVKTHETLHGWTASALHAERCVAAYSFQPALSFVFLADMKQKTIASC